MNEPPSLQNIVLPTSRVDEWEKEALQEPKSDDAIGRNGLGLKELRNVFAMIFAICMLCVPKIYLSNTIYYLSKDIANLQTQYDILLDENRRLKHEIEALRYQFFILKSP